MELLTHPDACRLWRRQLAAGETLALVPTMGALHQGHGALIRMARAQADVVAVSIFVNPLQFGPGEDFQRYPRPQQADLAFCQSLGVNAVFAPSPQAMYPRGMAACTRVAPPPDLSDRLCGASRPGHFTGVATVVLKLLALFSPDMAVFGEKDAQQYAILARMAADLDLDARLIRHPVVREADGLAMSSRNRYLSAPQQREAALSLSRILFWLRDAWRQAGEPSQSRLSAPDAFAEACQRETRDGFTLEYLEAVDDEDFTPSETLRAGVRLLIAGRVGDVRLIDTLLLSASA
ncbi:MAG: pantoate--beta-alanine ligase [Vampirovibrionales bacterium]|nr:pantoate--beta-alanine ligase [Vampirovibrionales bacterium]